MAINSFLAEGIPFVIPVSTRAEFKTETMLDLNCSLKISNLEFIGSISSNPSVVESKINSAISVVPSMLWSTLVSRERGNIRRYSCPEM